MVDMESPEMISVQI